MNYDEKNWKLLLIQLITKPDRIHVLNRAQIIDDAHHLSRAGLVPYNYYISLLEYLMMEDHVTPWSSATNGLTSIVDGIRRYPEEHLKFKVHKIELMDSSPLYTFLHCSIILGLQMYILRYSAKPILPLAISSMNINFFHRNTRKT